MSRGCARCNGCGYLDSARPKSCPACSGTGNASGRLEATSEHPEYLVSLTELQIDAIWDAGQEAKRVSWSPWSEIANRLALALTSRGGPGCLVPLTRAQIDAVLRVCEDKRRVYWTPWSEIADRLQLALKERER
jgi:hypothetical protein